MSNESYWILNAGGWQDGIRQERAKRGGVVLEASFQR